MESQQHGDQLKRDLRNRHVQLIALGGAIGTGLFLGSASVIQSAGPDTILGYAIAGFIALLIMRQLGEMVVEGPVAGSFSRLAYKYRGGFAGFSSGWNYQVLHVLVAMAELTTVGKYIRFQYPEIPAWVSTAVFFVLISTINLTNVKMFGEMELQFAIVRVIVVIAMILLGGWLPFSDNDGPQISVSNLWDQGSFLPHGFTGLVVTMVIIMFSFGELGLAGIAAAEADNPGWNIPKATNQAIYRILTFYIGSLAVLLSLMSWARATADTSPFVLIFHELDNTFVANALNAVVPTTAPSVYNNYVHCNSRILFDLAQQGNASKALMNIDKRGAPVNTILVPALTTALCMLISYLTPESAFGLLMALVVFTLMINQAVISPAHMKFRKAKQQQGVATHFPALPCPLGNQVCLILMAAVLVVMLMIPGMTTSVYLISIWIATLGIGYPCRQKTADAIKAH